MTRADFASRSAVGHGRNEAWAEVLPAISREFGRSLEWLLTGEELASLKFGLNQKCRSG